MENKYEILEQIKEKDGEGLQKSFAEIYTKMQGLEITTGDLNDDKNSLKAEIVSLQSSLNASQS